MPQFSGSDIDDAKKRVREMQERTKQLADSPKEEINTEQLSALIELLSPLKNKDITPLALFALISAIKEDCDKTLLLALIYILL
ncbi:MAG: hypothetical protein E7571_04620 [Ruminococcaceae bacterium]|nr:hypothetical protein [Oscillospiraceae bacterium]